MKLFIISSIFDSQSAWNFAPSNNLRTPKGSWFSSKNKSWCTKLIKWILTFKPRYFLPFLLTQWMRCSKKHPSRSIILASSSYHTCLSDPHHSTSSPTRYCFQFCCKKRWWTGDSHPGTFWHIEACAFPLREDGVCHDVKDRTKWPSLHRISRNPGCVSASEEPLLSFPVESETDGSFLLHLPQTIANFPAQAWVHPYQFYVP